MIPSSSPGALPELLPAAAGEAYALHARPRLMELLRAIALDVVYERGEGDRLFFRDPAGQEVPVLDLLGGYGASLFGHANPRIVARAREALEAQRPVHAQASVRSIAAELCRRLSERVGRGTGRSYVVTLASSGAEAVEAAIKHAEMEMARRIEAILDRQRRVMKEIRVRLREHRATLPESLFPAAARTFGVPRVSTLEELFLHVFRANADALGRAPLFLALEGAFHGKTTGALKLTHSPEYSSPWRRIGLRAAFLPVGDAGALERLLAQERVPFHELSVAPGGEVELSSRELVNVSALLVEPIQGEGGIREIPADYLGLLRQAADAAGFPLVVDEIQCGMGRSGTFLASEPSGVRGDYYLLSKSLGGGLAKVAALLVERERYVPDYGYLHTSTFAEDDLSSSIALAALDEVEREGQAVLRLCRDKGAHLLEALRELQSRFPGQLRDVRGRGLMLGIELAGQEQSPSPLLRLLSEQNLLGFFASGWLLHEERIRVAPTLSSHGTLRIEPSAYVSVAELDRFTAGVGRLLSAIRDADSYQLARFLVGRAGVPPDPGAPSPARRPAPDFVRPGWAPPRAAHKVAFLGHFLAAGDLRDWDEGLAGLSDAECEAFLDRTRGVLEPFVADRASVRSLRGDVVNVAIIGIPSTAAQLMESHRRGEARFTLALVEQAVELARRLGCGLVGLGGYTSIVTDSCRAVVDDEIALTSGNSLTASAALTALRQAARDAGIESARLAVLGATGNIGAVLAEVAADAVGDILLVGRPGAVSRLERVAAAVYLGAWERLVRAEAQDGLAAAIARTATVGELLRRGVRDGEDVGETIRAGIAAELEGWAPVRIATRLEDVRRANLVIAATNAPRPVILPEHLGEGPVVVCDVATPQDVDPVVLRSRPDVVVLKGGLVKPPLDQRLDIAGMPLEDGRMYGCLAETILLGFTSFGAGAGSDADAPAPGGEPPAPFRNFSYGRLSSVRVRRIGEIARMHGFTVEARRA